MARGGHRPNAGRRPDPNSARQKKLAAKAAKAPQVKDRTLTAADGTKKPEAGADWPFGKDPDAAQAPEGDGKSFETPLDFWKHVLKDPNASQSAKANAAYAMAPYVHAKLAPALKKEQAAERAKKAGTGRFGVRAAPKLVVNNP